MNIFIGNLVIMTPAQKSPSLSAIEKSVKDLFEVYGTVSSVSIKIKTGKNARGFGFVTMPDETQAKAAIAALDEKDYLGRPLNVNEERLKPVKPKKDYKEIKRLKLEAKNKTTVEVFEAPTIPEKETEEPKTYKDFKEVKEVKPRRKTHDIEQKAAQPTGAQAWTKRKGRGTTKPWKKKPGGVNKKFKYAR